MFLQNLDRINWKLRRLRAKKYAVIRRFFQIKANDHKKRNFLSEVMIVSYLEKLTWDYS